LKNFKKLEKEMKQKSIQTPLTALRKWNFVTSGFDMPYDTSATDFLTVAE
jgi:hypothetical protein